MLIRRDIRSDPTAGTSAIRAFFLNATEAFGVLTAIPLIGFFVIGNWAYNNGSDVTWAAGIALPVLIMVLLLELERRRAPAQRGVALVFQRLHFFGVQLILLFYLAGAFLYSLRPLVDGLFFGGRGTAESCTQGYCPSYNLAGLVCYLLWFLVCWLAYGLATRTDSSRNMRMILHGASLAFGIGSILTGVFVALELILLPLFKISFGLKDVLGYNAQYDFVSPLLLGALVSSVYHLLLRGASQRGLIKPRVRRLDEWAIAGILLAGTFWGGAGYGLYNLLQTLAPAPSGPDSHAWVVTLALLISGLSYIPLDLYLRLRYTRDPENTMGPRRGFVLALLGGGILALAIGGAVALYAWGTALLGSPVANWQQIAHSGLSAAIAGAVVLIIYLWAASREHLITSRARPAQPPASEAPSATPTIENVLDDLLAGRITRDEAAARLHVLSNTQTLVLA